VEGSLLSVTPAARIKRAVPAPVRRYVHRKRQDRERRKEHLEVYGPSQELSLETVSLLRDAPLEALRDSQRLEALLPRLGLNNERLDEFPDELLPYTGRGLLYWQYPKQFSPYLIALSRLDIRNYLEIGTRHGGTFVATVEYLSRFRPLDWAVGIDLQPAAGLDRYATTRPEVETLTMDSRSVRFKALLARRAPIDFVLIDGDHSEPGCRQDFELLASRARVIAFHDIVNGFVPGVRSVWEHVKSEHADTFDFQEFTGQYLDVVERKGHQLLGLGLAVRRA